MIIFRRSVITVSSSQDMSCDHKTCFEITGHDSCSDIISTEIAARAHCVVIFRTSAMLTLAARNKGGGFPIASQGQILSLARYRIGGPFSSPSSLLPQGGEGSPTPISDWTSCASPRGGSGRAFGPLKEARGFGGRRPPILYLAKLRKKKFVELSLSWVVTNHLLVFAI